MRGRKKKAIIYCRVSTAGQVEEGVSLDNQLHKCKSFLEAQKDEYEILKVFREEGQSGKTEWRDEFQAMMNYIRENKYEIDAVCFYAINRLGRNVQLVLNTINELQEYDITVLSVTENLDTSNSMGRFVLNIFASLSELESDQIAQRVFDNMHFSVSNYGTWQGARYYPYGYKPQNELDEKGNRPLQIIPEQAEQVKLIFEWYVKGLDGDTNVGTYRIARRLNELGYKYLRDNSEWTNKRVFDIIKNAHFYAGWYYWNRTGTRNKVIYEETEFGIKRKLVMSKRAKTVRPVKETYIKPKEEWAINKGPHQPIISESMWKAAEAKHERRKNTNENLDTTRQPKHYLTGIMCCPDCGGRMIASTLSRTTKKSGRIREVYYRCLKATAGENCDHNVIKEDYILPQVLEVFYTYYPILIKKKIDQIIIAQLYANQNLRTKQMDEVLALENQIENHLNRIESLYNDYVEGLLLKENYLRLKTKIEGEIRVLEEQIKTIEDKDKQLIISSQEIESIKKIINNFVNAEEYFNSLNKLAQMSLLKEVFLKIEVNKIKGKKGKNAVSVKRIVINKDIIPFTSQELQNLMSNKELSDRFLHLQAEIMKNAKMKVFSNVHVYKMIEEQNPEITELVNKYNITFE